MEIKILGPGCSRCNATEKVVMDVLAETGITANVEKSHGSHENCRIRGFRDSGRRR